MIQINAKKLNSALSKLYKFTSKDSAREYINGVRFEMNGDKVRMIATDGHKMLIINEVVDSGEISPFTLGNDDVLNIIAITKKRKWHYDYLNIELEGETLKITVICDKRTYTCRPIGGTYPDYTRVLPKKEDLKAVKYGLNGSLLLESLKAIGAYKFAFNLDAKENGGPVVLTSANSEDTICIIMPMKI